MLIPKTGIVVMLLRNLVPINGNMNETRYVVKNVKNNVLLLLTTSEIYKITTLTSW